jgi:hypothetical protein
MNENEPINGHELKNKQVPETAAAIAGSDTSQPPATATPERVTRWAMFTVDGKWPPDGVNHFDCEIPQPAIFQKAYPLRGDVVGLDGKPSFDFRMVFLVCPDTKPRVYRFLSMSLGMALAVKESKPIPTFLDVLSHPLTGRPVALFSIPTLQGDESLPNDVEEGSNDLPPVSGEIDLGGESG